MRVFRGIVLIIVLVFVSNCFGQKEQIGSKKTSIATIGFLQGGGAMVGIDLEQLISSRIGLSAGVGFLAFGTSAHYHIKPWVNSSSIAINYWHQGIGSNHVQSLIGPSYVFRLPRLLSFQLGVAGLLDKGPNYRSAFGGKTHDTLLIYSIGLYF